MPTEAILIVDDEVDLLELFKVALRSVGRPIMTAKDGDLALQLLNESAPALIILDIAMPAPNGIEVLRRVRADSRFDDTKILILTANPTRVSEDDLALANGILGKPLMTRSLEQAVRDMLSK